MVMGVINLKGDKMVSKLQPISSGGRGKEASEQAFVIPFEPGFQQINWIFELAKGDTIRWQSSLTIDLYFYDGYEIAFTALSK